jgi:spore coat protein CotH
MKHRLSFLLPTLLLASCQTSSVVNEAQRLYDTFWANDTKLKVELTLSQTNLQAIETYGKDKNTQFNDYYFPADFRLTVNDTIYDMEEVGVRQKGNIFSRGPFLNDEGFLSNPFHFRLSFDQTYDEDFYAPLGLKKSWINGEPAYETRQSRRLFGMKSLELKWNRSNDPSLINQVYAASLYRQHDVLAPQSTLSAVSIMTEQQGHDVGLYTINEIVDEIFIRRHFEGAAGNGDLYKALWSNQLLYPVMVQIDSNTGSEQFKPNFVGIENTEEGYHPVYDLKTNKNTSQHEALMNLVKTLHTLNQLQDLSLRKSTFESVLDTEAFLNYAAISYLIGNPDDMRNLTNNTYIYFHGVTKKAYFIPYDMDWSLGVTWDDELTQKMATHSPLSIHDPFQQVIQNPLYWFTILDGFVTPANRYPRIAGYQEPYLSMIHTVANDAYFSEESFVSLFDMKQGLYDGMTFTLPSNSDFVSSDTFIHHHQLITNTVKGN